MLAAARRVLDSDARHLHAYMPNAGFPQVREAVARRLTAATGLPYTANHVLMTVGAGAALNIVLKALLNPGDEVITVAPFFAEYVFYAENHGGRLIVVPPTADLLPDVAAIEAAITPRTRAILVNSPNNPSGVIYPAVGVRRDRARAGARRPAHRPHQRRALQGARVRRRGAARGSAARDPLDHRDVVVQGAGHSRRAHRVPGLLPAHGRGAPSCSRPARSPAASSASSMRPRCGSGSWRRRGIW